MENCKQTLIPFPHFILRVGRYSMFSLALIAFSLGIGTPGYHYFGQLNWLDSFHMSCMILTGMGPVAEMVTQEAKLFSSFYALFSGVAFITNIGLLIAPLAHRFFHILHAE